MIFDSVEKSSKGTRRLRYAFAASVLVHLLLLWPSVSEMEVKDTPSPLQATILEPSLSIAPPIMPVPVIKPQESGPAISPLTSRRAVAPAPTFTQASTQPEPSVPIPLIPETPAVKPPLPKLTPGTALTKAEASSRVSSASLPGLTAPSVTSLGSDSAGKASKAPVALVSADDLSRYRLALASQARRFKRYPTQARALGWTGTADIRVDVDRDGHVRSAILARTSGHEALDRAALAMIDAGAQRARLPDSLRGRYFSVTLPVVFNLEDE